MVAGEPERGGGGGEAGGERPAAWPSASASTSDTVARGGAVVSSSGVGVAEGEFSGDALCAMYMGGERHRTKEEYRLNALSVSALRLRIECGAEGEKRRHTEREAEKKKKRKDVCGSSDLDALSELTVFPF